MRLDIEAACRNGDAGSYGNGGRCADAGGGGSSGKAGGYDNEDALGDNDSLTFGIQNDQLRLLLGLNINCQSNQMAYRYIIAYNTCLLVL